MGYDPCKREIKGSSFGISIREEFQRKWMTNPKIPIGGLY